MSAFLLIAADATPSSSALIEAVEACRKIVDDPARLACFDRTAAAMADARARRDFLVTDRTQVRKTRRSLFGFAMPSFRLFGGDDKDDAEEDIKQIDSKVASIASSGYDQYSITLEDGSVWQTTERAQTFSPRQGDKIIIWRGPFGFTAKSGYGRVPIRRIK